MRGIVVKNTTFNPTHQDRQREWQTKIEQDPSLAERTWRLMPGRFGIPQKNIVQLRHELDVNMANILRDSLEGQCQSGHSCHEFATQARKDLLDELLNANKTRRVS